MVKKGNGTTTSDSAAQTITVTKATVPTANKTNCTTSANNNGTITNVTTEMEYKADDGNWTDVTGTAITGLAPGTYYVRVKAAGTALASEPQTLTIGAFSSTGKEITVRIHTHGGTSSDTVSGGDQTQLGVTHTITVTPDSGKGAGLLQYQPIGVFVQLHDARKNLRRGPRYGSGDVPVYRHGIYPGCGRCNLRLYPAVFPLCRFAQTSLDDWFHIRGSHRFMYLYTKGK